MQVNEARPPYVTFEAREQEDRDATIKEGHYVGKDVIYAIITPQGSRDKIEKIAEDWLRDTRAAVKEERFPMQWLEAYERIYRGWLETREIPLDGVPILTWAAVSPSQQKAILDANIRTVEDLAQASASALSQIGMGAQMLKDRAIAWLASAKDIGKVAEESASMKKLNETLAKQVNDLTEQNKILHAKVEALTKENA